MDAPRFGSAMPQRCYEIFIFRVAFHPSFIWRSRLRAFQKLYVTSAVYKGARALKRLVTAHPPHTRVQPLHPHTRQESFNIRATTAIKPRRGSYKLFYIKLFAVHSLGFSGVKKKKSNKFIIARRSEYSWVGN